jgi:hypothetical protein
MFRMIKRSPWIAIGAAGAWFLDPIFGPNRRAKARRALHETLGHEESAADPTPVHIDATS